MVLWVGKTAECFKHCLMGHPSRNMEDSGAENDLNCGGMAQEASEEKNFSMLPRDLFVKFCEESGCLLLLSGVCLRLK